MNKTNKESLVCFGIRSDTNDNLHIPFIDFDIPKHKLDKIIDLLKNMQITYHLSDIYILESDNGYNAFSLDKMEFELISSMLINYHLIDDIFIALAVKRGFYVLRMSADKNHIRTIAGIGKYEKSTAHYNFFTEIMDYPILKHDDNYDYLTEYKIIAYRSAKNGYCKIKL